MHPIAGRCRHCKADLAAQRGARPAAAAALPALRHGHDAPAPAPAPSPFAPGTPPQVHPPVVAMPLVADASHPVLPPRPTGRMQAGAPRPSIWRNWPVIVIVLASLAIATAVVLMVYPPASNAKADSRRLPPPPAPERMDTSPLVPALPPPSTNGVPPKRSGIDPWAKPDPDVPDPARGSIDPDDLAIDPFNGRGGGNPFGALGGLGDLPFGGLGGVDPQNQFFFALGEHVCTRAKSCGNTQAAQMCDVFAQLGQGGAAPPRCAAGRRCLSKIDQLDCDALSGNDLLGAFALAQDCLDAIQSC